MTEANMGRAPSLRTVVSEQARMVGLAVRRNAIAVGLVIIVPALLSAIMIAVPGAARVVVDSTDLHGLNLDPGEGWGQIAALMGALFPMAVWKGERIFGDSQLWSLPVDRRRHAFMKVGAGWGWLMAYGGAVCLVLVLLALLTGGAFGGQETRLLVLDRASFLAGRLHPESFTWATAWWQWVLPFTTATVTYVLASALLLGTRHPRQWLAGAAVVLLLVVLFSNEVLWLDHVAGAALRDLVVHPLGLDSILSGGVDTLTRTVRLPSGESVAIWTGTPSTGRWAAATLLWLGIGGASLYAALFRHRER